MNSGSLNWTWADFCRAVIHYFSEQAVQMDEYNIDNIQIDSYLAVFDVEDPEDESEVARSKGEVMRVWTSFYCKEDPCCIFEADFDHIEFEDDIVKLIQKNGCGEVEFVFFKATIPIDIPSNESKRV